MAKNYIEEGNVIQLVAPYALSSGDGVAVGASKFGVAQEAIANGATGSVCVKGVFEVTKKSTDVMAVGDLLYWDPVAKNITITSTSNILAGYCWKAAGNGALVVQISVNK